MKPLDSLVSCQYLKWMIRPKIAFFEKIFVLAPKSIKHKAQSTKHKAQSTKHKTQNTKQEIPVNKINPGDVDIGQTVCGGEGSFSDLVSFYVT